LETFFSFLNLKKGTGSGGQVNGGLSSIPSPTMPNFGMAPNSANGQNGPNGQDPASVYNGLAQGYPSRESPIMFVQLFRLRCPQSGTEIPEIISSLSKK
jgi:hypothetical protein